MPTPSAIVDPPETARSNEKETESGVRSSPGRGKRIDSHPGNVGLQDVVGGCASFHDSPARLVKEF